ncbi:winged helix-turn-helix transcriptional regulator [Paludisphaera mucosa]|uniref:Helix-turn-helix domain-containing protein n=1 Tax=Paludisphaera mucosa TaxID=3030827 RepID=A0ABT6FDD4_9BACT|nr:helix-turn-helix domain-containing protein [Paludisphaera mucosa]MDG3005552.1 helix-turn-helix domain-containing protein [Paludisphaera mucosa]
MTPTTPPRPTPAEQTAPSGEAAAPTACPAAFAMELVAHKWTIHILFALHRADAPIRFRKLQRETAPITQKELTKRLRELERSGLVARRIFAEVPPRVEYRLTDLGRTLMPALVGLHRWAEQHGGEVVDHWRRAERESG